MENKDLLDLCRLNLMEETIEYSPAVDRDVTLKAIDVAKRQLMLKIGPGDVDLSPSVIKHHEECDKVIEESIVYDDKACAEYWADIKRGA